VRFRFSDYVLDVTRREFWRGGEPAALEPQVFDLLVHLICNRDRVVSKDELLESVWAGRIVSDSTLTSRINAARKAVGDSGEAQRLIRTVPRRGFRFIGEVAEEDAAHRAAGHIDRSIAEQARRARPEAPRLSIVVLPFDNLSGDPEQEYFADGITENLTTDLSLIPQSFVIARGTAFAYKGRAVDIRQVGRELGVRYVLEGSVQRFGTAVQVNAQMIDAENGAHLWADRFDGELSNIVGLRDAVATHVWRSVYSGLPVWENRRTLRERPDNPEAIDYVLRALASWNSLPATRERCDDVRSLLEAALQIDPENVTALTWLALIDIAEAADLLSADRAEQLRHAESMIDRVLAVAPATYLVHRARADVLRLRKKNREAIVEYEAALRLNPNDVDSYVRIGFSKGLIGYHEEGLANIQEALQRSPKDREIPKWNAIAGHIRMWMGDFEAGTDLYRRATLGLPGWGICLLYLACASRLIDRVAEAHAAFAEMKRALPNLTITKWRENVLSDEPRYLAWRERCYDAAREMGLPEE